MPMPRIFLPLLITLICAAPHAPKHPIVSKTVTKPLPVAASLSGFGVCLMLDKPTYAIPATQNSLSHLHATLTLFNHTETPLSLSIGGQLYNWQILDANGQVVWDYAKGRLFPHYRRIVTLQHSELSYTDDLPLQNQDGTPLAPGNYQLRATLPHILNASATVGFTITR